MQNASSDAVGMIALAVAYPREIRTNDYYRERYPEVVATAEQRSLSQLFRVSSGQPALDAWDLEMAPYLADPFRGTVRRRVLAPGETALSLETTAARRCLEAARLEAGCVDLCLVGSLRPDTFAVGDAAFLARELGLKGAAWNVESACSGGLVALQTARALVAGGEYDNVLVVISCTYSRDTDPTDSLSWFLADGAGAFLVARVPDGAGVLGCKVLHTADTCGAFSHELVCTGPESAALRMQSGRNASRVLRESSIVHLRACCDGALARAGVKLNDVDFFVFNTPTAWYSNFAARFLGIDPKKTLSTYAEYANVGPALMPTNLFRAAATRRIAPGDLVLVYTIGSVSTAAAALLRWGDVALGPDPETGARSS